MIHLEPCHAREMKLREDHGRNQHRPRFRIDRLHRCGPRGDVSKCLKGAFMKAEISYG